MEGDIFSQHSPTDSPKALQRTPILSSHIGTRDAAPHADSSPRDTPTIIPSPDEKQNQIRELVKEADYILHFLGLRILEALLCCCLVAMRCRHCYSVYLSSAPRTTCEECKYLKRTDSHSARTEVTQNKTATGKPLDVRLDLESGT